MVNDGSLEYDNDFDGGEMLLGGCEVREKKREKERRKGKEKVELSGILSVYIA